MPKTNHIRMNRSMLILLGLVVVGLASVAIFHFCSEPSESKTPFPGFHRYRISMSPDGRYTCVVGEKTPPFLLESPYLYKFAIVEAQGQGMVLLPGKELEIDKDSCGLDIHEIVWDAQGVTIIEDAASPRAVARCVIRDGRQYWTDNPLPASTTRSASSLPAASKTAQTQPG